MKILALNGGSSSFKCRLDDVGDLPLPCAAPNPFWERHVDLSPGSKIAELLEPVLASVPGGVDIVGHRIVHGGPVYRESAFLTADVRAAIAREVEFAPAHNRFELEAVQTIDRVLGTKIPQVAVFDTAFHVTLPPAAYTYAGPHAWLERGIRRYGFHGVSHQYAARRAADLLGKDPRALKLVTCHIGNGASLAAVQAGKSIDTTMGFTPLEGLMMGTRSGSIDPGILIYLLRHGGYSADQLDHLLNQESGLLGISGLSGDMREILRAMETGNDRARLAWDVYAHRLIREAGAMISVLGGADAIVFTGGVGENCPPLRATVCSQLGFMGLKLDAARNAVCTPDQDVAAPDSKVRVLVIRAKEEWEIARECHRLARAVG
jgi:acetate kinase